MIEKISDNPDLLKIDKCFVINTNDHQYNAALLRKKTHKRLGTLEERVAGLEILLQKVLDILQKKDT